MTRTIHTGVYAIQLELLVDIGLFLFDVGGTINRHDERGCCCAMTATGYLMQILKYTDECLLIK